MSNIAHIRTWSRSTNRLESHDRTGRQSVYRTTPMRLRRCEYGAHKDGSLSQSSTRV